MTKRKVKNITVCVSPEIYRQTRHLAAEYDSTVSTIVAWLLQRLPEALERTRFPNGGPIAFSEMVLAEAAAAERIFPQEKSASTALKSSRYFRKCRKPSAQPTPAVDDSTNPNNLTPEKNPSSEKAAISGRETVTPHLTQEISAACSQPSGAVTALVQLYSASEPAQNERLIDHPQIAVQPL